LLLRRGHGRHYDNHRSNVSGRDVIPILYAWEIMRSSGRCRPVFTHGPKGPGPRAENFQGRHIKKIEIEVWYSGGKKRLSTREKFKGDLYWKHYVFLCCFCLHITEYGQISLIAIRMVPQ
jgi:hypothetical protein